MYAVGAGHFAAKTADRLYTDRDTVLTMEEKTDLLVKEGARALVYRLVGTFVSLVSEQQWSKDLTSLETDAFDPETVAGIVDRATHLFRNEPNVLYIPAPVVVVGDIHGQCCDLLQVFRHTGGSSLIEDNDVSARHADPDHMQDEAQKYLLLGDYVDRGSFSCECIMFLLALKVLHPTTVYLIRGNHESRCMTATEYPDGVNFRTECVRKLGPDIYDSLMDCFDCLPICSVVHSDMGRWFCCHGGLGPKMATIEELDKLPRCTEPPLKGALCDLLWADPLLEGVLGYKLSDREYEEFLELDFMPNPPRGCSHLFGYAAIKPFLDENNLIGIIRAHQCKEEGISYEYSSNRKNTFPFPCITTVFSAANYCGSYGNKGAVLRFSGDHIEVIKYSSSGEVWIEHAPYTHTPHTVGVKVGEREKEAAPCPPKPSPTPSQNRSSKLWKHSLARIKEGHTGEEGKATPRFQAALQKDARNEVHPGWRSVQRLGRMVGKIQLLRKQITPPTSTLPPVKNTSPTGAPLPQALLGEVPHPQALLGEVSLPQALLGEVSQGDTHQLRVVFDTIDRDKDGFLSLTELEEFAKDLSVHSTEGEVKQLLQAMDKDNSGTVSFEEFTHYMAQVSMSMDTLSLCTENKTTSVIGTTPLATPIAQQQ